MSFLADTSIRVRQRAAQHVGAVDDDAASDWRVPPTDSPHRARERIQHKVYIRTTGYRSTRFDACRETARQDGWHVQDISCAHDMMIDQPELLAHILSTLAADSERTRTVLGQLANLPK